VSQASAFGSGHDPGFPGSLSGESASPSAPPPAHARSLSLSEKYIKSFLKKM